MRRGRDRTVSGAADRLSRLLALVPYLLARPGARVEDVAAAFGVDQSKLVDDLQLLFVCGLPGHLPDDLIEASFDGGVIHLGNADTIARPLRLSSDEALALLIGLRTLADSPYLAGMEPDSREALDRAAAKLERAAGDAGAPNDVVTVAMADQSSVLPLIRDALARGRRLHLSYYVARRDETTERDVDPLRVDVVDGHTYLQAWCRLVEDVRIFRLDRMVGVEVLETPSAPPPDAAVRNLAEGVFAPSADDLLVTLDLEPSARWVADYYAAEAVTERGDGRLRVSLRTPDLGWVTRLVLRLGGEAAVVEPAALSRQVATEVAMATRVTAQV